MRTIHIDCKKDISCLAGYESGVQAYKTQIAPISISESIHIVIPKNIVYISSSFIQGMLKEIVELCAKNGIAVREYLSVETLSDSAYIRKSFDRYIC